MISYRIFYDEIQDAWNWWNSIINYNQSKKLKTPAEKKLAKKIKSLSFGQSKPLILDFLHQNPHNVSDFQATMEQQFSEYFQPAIKKLEEVTEHPLFKDDLLNWRKKAITPRSDIKIPEEDLLFPITTFPCMVVFYAEGVYFTYAKIDNELWGMPLDGTLHELLHLQCNAYWREDKNSSISTLSEDDYYALKESLTVILDEEWKPIITLPDCSYPEFKPLRDKLHRYWREHHDFEKLMQYGFIEVQKFTKQNK